MSFISRLERHGSVDSTQSIVRAWLDSGVPQVCVAVADEQREGRGRQGRSWQAPPGAALLASIGLRPTHINLIHAWRLAATASLAMLDAAEEAAGLDGGALALKWPNDIVASTPDGHLAKVAGALGETTAEEDRVTTAVIGIGINVDWAARDFPPDLAAGMTSLRELAHGRPVDRDQLLDAWLARLEPRLVALENGGFDAAPWSSRQVTNESEVEIDLGGRTMLGTASGVDPETGALILRADGATIHLTSAEMVRCRVVTPPAKPWRETGSGKDRRNG